MRGAISKLDKKTADQRSGRTARLDLCMEDRGGRTNEGGGNDQPSLTGTKSFTPLDRAF